MKTAKGYTEKEIVKIMLYEEGFDADLDFIKDKELLNKLKQKRQKQIEKKQEKIKEKKQKIKRKRRKRLKEQFNRKMVQNFRYVLCPKQRFKKAKKLVSNKKNTVSEILESLDKNEKELTKVKKCFNCKHWGLHNNNPPYSLQCNYKPKRRILTPELKIRNEERIPLEKLGEAMPYNEGIPLEKIKATLSNNKNGKKGEKK